MFSVKTTFKIKAKLNADLYYKSLRQLSLRHVNATCEIALTRACQLPFNVILAYDFASALALSKSECLWCEGGDPLVYLD
jgi:hypothetical protein